MNTHVNFLPDPAPLIGKVLPIDFDDKDVNDAKKMIRPLLSWDARCFVALIKHLTHDIIACAVLNGPDVIPWFDERWNGAMPVLIGSWDDAAPREYVMKRSPDAHVVFGVLPLFHRHIRGPCSVRVVPWEIRAR